MTGGPRHWRLLSRALDATLAGLVLYLLAAYVAAPAVWRHRAGRHPALASVPTLTTTTDGIPGDPVNVTVIATEEELQRLMHGGGWFPADPITFRSALRIAADTVAHRPYETAPVSRLLLWGRQQDLAFEKPVGHDPRTRHHVRFWRSAERDASGRPLWAGAATFDTHAGVSHRTGQLTHHIAPDVDGERDELVADLLRTGDAAVSWQEKFQKAPRGRNGGGDPWFTDGKLAIVRFEPKAVPGAS